MGIRPSSYYPKHIAIIMDGNGRWAKSKGLPRVAGHMQGASTVRAVVEICAKSSIKALTLYTFSTENWKRPKEEVSALMKLLNDHIEKEIPSLMKNSIRFNTIGEFSGLPPEVQNKIELAKSKTKNNSGGN